MLLPEQNTHRQNIPSKVRQYNIAIEFMGGRPAFGPLEGAFVRYCFEAAHEKLKSLVPSTNAVAVTDEEGRQTIEFYLAALAVRGISVEEELNQLISTNNLKW